MSYKVKFILYLFCLINCPQEASENKAETLVNKNWLNEKKQNDFLLVCLQKDGNTYKNTEKNIEIEIEEIVKINTIEGEGTKITQKFTKNILEASKENKELLQINLQKYALFEIKIKKNIEAETVETIYLYCSDIESTANNGMFENCNSIEHVSVVIGDVKNIKNISKMFYNCNKLVSVCFEYLLVDIDKLNCNQIFEKCKNLSCIRFVWKKQDENQQHPLYVYLNNKKKFKQSTNDDRKNNNCKTSTFYKENQTKCCDFCIFCCSLCCSCFIQKDDTI